MTSPEATHADHVREVCAPLAEPAGLVLDDVRVAKAGRRLLVTITVDLPDDAVGSAKVDDVAELSRGIAKALDKADFGDDTGYVLEVTTPGIDRPLTERRHWQRARTRMVTATLTDGSTLSGRLMTVADDGLGLECADTSRTIGWDEVSTGRIDVEFSKTPRTS